MFDFVNKHKRFAQIILGAIGLTFAFWGIDSYTRMRSASSNVVATVNGLKISRDEFNQELQRQQDQLRRVLGDKVDPSMLDTPEARTALLDSLVSQRLLSYAALRAGLTVSDQTLAEAIRSIPAFQEDGKFSKANYELVLRSQNPPLSPEQFEASLRHDLAVQQLVQSIADSAIAPRSVAARLSGIENQKREVSEAKILAAQFLPQVKIDDAEVKAYYEAHQDEFRVPERVRAEYVVLSAKDLAQQEPVSEAELEAAYKAHASQYRVDEQRRASHILVKTKEEAEKIAAEARKDPSRFAELAKKYSQDPGSAQKGGDLGWFSAGMMVKPFSDAAFALKKGQISDPVKTQYGWHVIELTGVQPAHERPLADVRKELSAQLAAQKGMRQFDEDAEKFRDVVYEQPDSLKPAADRFKLPVQTTGWISRNGGAEAGPVGNPKLLSALFSKDAIDAHHNTDAVEVAPNTLVAARVVEHKPATLRTLDEVKSTIADELGHRKAAALAEKEGEAELARLRKGEDAGVKWGKTRTVSRADPGGATGEVLRLAVSADVSKLPAYAGAPLAGEGYVLVRVAKVIDAPPAKKAQDDEDRLASALGNEQYSAYLASLRSGADIEVNRVKLETK